MSRLYPPIIENIIPAFYDDTKNIKIIIPFSMNRAVSSLQVKGIAVKIKTVQSSNYLYTKKIVDQLNYNLDSTCEVIVSINKDEINMQPGQYYKFQIAYINTEDEVGYYSSVGVGKYTTQPKVEIIGLEYGKSNSHTYNYIGHYSQENGDINEIEYSYNFSIYDKNSNLIYTTQDQLHNSENDAEIGESFDDFYYSYDLLLNNIYYIKYTVKTINNLEISSPKYRIMQKTSIDMNIDSYLGTASNYDNGYITVSLLPKNNTNNLITGSFLLSRASEDSNFTNWEKILYFNLFSQSLPIEIWKDFTIEQGKKYIYSIQQYNEKGLYSNRLQSEEVYGDFEDAFLYDGERQLKIRYNPKMTSFKKDLLETKIDTIGSKHPFIFRNGNVDYKEFPISGLISYYLDSDHLFLTKEEFNPEGTTNLTGQNITQERIFKMKVYEWLTNGKNKIFRSPTEGNFIVRLMNVSLSPNDSLGRMLHTFNATAYEMAEYNYESLSEFNPNTLQDLNTKYLRFESVDLSQGKKVMSNNEESFIYDYGNGQIINSYPAYAIKIVDMNPGDRLILYFDDGVEQIIQVGITGSYSLDLEKPIQKIILDEGTTPKGTLTYSYYLSQTPTFGEISDIQVEEIPCRQFIGEHNILEEIESIKYLDKWIKNPKISLTKVYQLSAQKRSIERITQRQENDKIVYYKDKKYTQILGEDKDLFTLYALGTWDDAKGFQIEKYLDFSEVPTKEIEPKDYYPYIKINNSEIGLEDTQDFSLSGIDDFNSIYCGNGCSLNISYQIRNDEYYIENNSGYKDIQEAKQAYNISVNQLNELFKSEISDIDKTIELEAQYRNQINDNYNKYVLALVNARAEEAELL